VQSYRRFLIKDYGPRLMVTFDNPGCIQSGTASITEADVSAVLINVRQKYGVPGIGAHLKFRDREISAFVGEAVADEGQPLAETSHFEISCLMKFFCSAATLYFCNQQKINLEAPIDYYLSELASSFQTNDKITVKMLLSHTSGYQGLNILAAGIRWGMTWAQFQHYLRSAPRLFRAGTMFNYEHSENVILGELLQRISARVPLELIMEILFNSCTASVLPISIAKMRTETRVGNHIARSGKYVRSELAPFSEFWINSLSSLTMTLHDIVEVFHSVFCQTKTTIAGETSPAIDPYKLMAIKHIPLLKQVRSDIQVERLPEAFGLGCGIYSSGILGHNGSTHGQTCAVRCARHLGLTFAVAINAYSPQARDEIVCNILSMADASLLVNQYCSKTTEFFLTDLMGELEPSSVAGTYLGSLGGRVDVGWEKGCLNFFPGEPPHRWFFSIRPSANGYRIDSERPVSLSFISIQNEKHPALLLGVHAYRRIS
jgi:Beta-lactamase